MTAYYSQDPFPLADNEGNSKRGKLGRNLGTSFVPSLFFACGGKIVSSMAYFIFVPCGLKIGDATSLKMYYVMSHKS